MSRSVKVLFFSSSTVTYSEGEGSPSLVQLMATALGERRPEIDWQCEGQVLYISPTSSQRAARALNERGPDIVIFRPTGRAFMEDEVMSRVRDRWPRIYPYGRRAAEVFRNLSGGQRDGGPGPRGLLFSVPRWLAARTIGEAPPIPVEQATAYALETLDVIAGNESVDVICRVSVDNGHSKVDPAERKRRKEYFVGHLRAHCAQRLIPFFDNADMLREAGLTYVLGPDQWHYPMHLRSLEASAVADSVIAAIDAAPINA